MFPVWTLANEQIVVCINININVCACVYTHNDFHRESVAKLGLSDKDAQPWQQVRRRTGVTPNTCRVHALAALPCQELHISP